MGAINYLGIFMLVVSACFVNCDDGWFGRTWQTNINYNNSHNWDVGRLPCEADRIILQKSESIVLQLPEGKNSIRELVLPSYTEVLLPRNGLLQFTGKMKALNCDGQDVIFKPVHPSEWIDPQNWDGWNSATPDLERVPCVSDRVRFLSESTYKVVMPDYVKIGSLQINDVEVNSIEFINDEELFGGANPFQTADGDEVNFDIRGVTCDTNRWCECGNEYLRSQICKADTCSVPLCRQPVQPYGFCCSICGVYFILENDSPNKRQLADHVSSFLRDKGVLWHASKVGEHLQVVLVEEDEYTGKVTDVAESLKESLTTGHAGWTAREYHASGRVWYPITFGQVLGHFLSLMVVAILILAAIIVFYSRDWSWVPFSPLAGRPFVFARFENQTGEVVVESEERQAIRTFQPQTFDNPMYEATRQDQGNTISIETPIYTELTESLITDSVEDFADIAK